MPIYFGEVAPHCPISRDQPLGPMATPPIRTRTTIPRATDLASAIAAMNILRSIVTNIVSNKVINNVYSGPILTPYPPGTNSVISRKRTSRWIERKDLRVKARYKYYGSNKENWVITERIEKMVWYDKGWKSYLVWEYGDKGEGEPV